MNITLGPATWDGEKNAFCVKPHLGQNGAFRFVRFNVQASGPLNRHGRYAFREPAMDVDHLVVGGGVVGLAIAAELVKMYPHRSTIVVERHSQAGQEIRQVSRNSEVIHAGLYYPPTSLKTRRCLRGRQLLYEYCTLHSVPHKRIGKLIVGHQHQVQDLKALHEHAQSVWRAAWAPEGPNDYTAIQVEDLTPPTRYLSEAEAHELEPDLGPAIKGAVLSSSTGIVDSHALLQSLERDIQNSGVGIVAYATRVVRVDPAKDGWVVQARSSNGPNTDSIRARTLINASGLSANLIPNSLRDGNSRIPMYFARGSYAAYSSKVGVSKISRLLYPVPEAAHTFASLGTHLTIDMAGSIRFGPDLEWVDAQDDADEDEGTWWESLLECELTEERREEMHQAITQYLPGVKQEGLREDYCGIRPKLVGPGAGFQDFVIQVDSVSDYGMLGNATMITLLGIESPGLTSCMSLAEHVAWVVQGAESRINVGK
ncbi:uncharacterized protein EI90DRAFT_2970998 [Cantharellus anzutake]|uniref:uncharacterized protein n=1 Tax=Cantharellus anzutake TaxID=1750568 RepID=UPI0019084D8D|nr:uncharacterized protein EI90DRAFT_2970998 [Cantharellus anzutake]KAF8333547.1 hypothetical protein EI90DRAFT_2970998 [Cantharellus anzutake]